MAKPKRICSIEECGKYVAGHGLCSTHYSRVRRAGLSFKSSRAKPNSTARFVEAAATHEGPECLIWPYGVQGCGKGYGQAFYKGVKIAAHRIVCIIAHGDPVSPDMEAAHTCRNGNNGCVSAAHLKWATAKENQFDRVTDGTAPRGEANGRAILTAEQASEIRSLYIPGVVSQQMLASQFGVDQTTVSKIIRGTLWPTP